MPSKKNTDQPEVQAPSSDELMQEPQMEETNPPEAGEVQAVDRPEVDPQAADALEAADLVTVHIEHEHPDDTADTLPVTVNGEDFEVPYGQDVKVPTPVADVLMHAYGEGILVRD